MTDQDGYNDPVWVDKSPTHQEWDALLPIDRLYHAASAFITAGERRSPKASSHMTARQERTFRLLGEAVRSFEADTDSREPAEEI